MMLKIDLTSIVFCIVGIRKEHQRLREHGVSTQSKEETVTPKELSRDLLSLEEQITEQMLRLDSVHRYRFGSLRRSAV